MQGFGQQARLGDRMLVVVGALVAVAIGSLFAFALLVANRVDADSAQRERDLARARLTRFEFSVRHDLVSFAHRHAAAAHERAFDPDWVHANFGVRMKNGHNRLFVLDAGDAPVYAAVLGDLAAVGTFEPVKSKALPLVEQVRAAHDVGSSAHLRAAETGLAQPPPEPAFGAAFRRVEGRPAFVGVVALTSAQMQGDGAEVPVAIAVSFVDDALLRRLARDLAFDSIELAEGSHERARDGGRRLALPLPLGADDAPAWLAWEPRAPGWAMLRRLLPALFGMAALIGAVTVLVLLYLRRTTERLAQSERRAKELAYRDVLTGLANRVQLLEALSEQLPAARADKRVALFLLDLDGFKDINDTLGHPVGDEVLFAVGERLVSAIGERGTAVRYGGDEFALLVPVGEGDEDATAICRRICDSMRAPVFANGQPLSVSATIGVAIAPDDAHEPEQLLRRADIALYRAKAEGRGAYRLFEPSYEELLHKRSAIERDLARAIDQQELAVRFQPLLAADGERIVGVEALVRWNHPERGVVPPSEFIPVAEQSGLVVPLDEWVLRRACEHAAQWPGLSLAVNLSPSNFRQPNVAERLRLVLSETGFDPRRLEIEITESMLLGATSEVLGDLSELRRIGIRIALDDFGTGYSSLGYLRRFPVDKIKIDKSFVQSLGITEDAAAIIECVVRLGRAIGLAVTAEGVETREQHRFVRAVGCHQVQGYLFSPPVEADQITQLLRPAEFPLRPVRAQLAAG